MFEDEARIASQLEHPHIARCLDFGRVDDAWYIAFEFVDGKDMRALFDRCAKAGAPPPAWFAVLRLLTDRRGARLRPRAQGRDRPARVDRPPRRKPRRTSSCRSTGDVKLIDFGIAKAAGKLSRTQVGTIKGKFGYMSPEQVNGHEVDHRADIFSLGICMWELLDDEAAVPGGERATRSWRRSSNHSIEPPLPTTRSTPRAGPHRLEGTRKGCGRALPCSEGPLSRSQSRQLKGTIWG